MLPCRGPGRRLAAVGVFLSLWVSVRGASAAPPGSDEFFATDKTAHFFVAAGIAGVGYGVTTAFAEERWKALVVGGGAALVAGALKEGYDGLGGGDPSWKDFTWDVAGAVAGLLVAFAIDVAVHGGTIPALTSRPQVDGRASPLTMPLSMVFE